ncbi:hypothetical protein BDY17DRAFT_293393 [Neohortaea acidophila]|uniref:BTB domain-containing protein n=1 Tax=Neohortaea acidophila TaxID=245834 RepID=A0A6A6Q029_9PEZI|nr:uncharacterized protein BDY17DRAFT_293393 [Neohortaea acidophila]KAF2485339.1 hypothetical protein BDY17DRAFT_293393 [Neohortaea acidophila]
MSSVVAPLVTPLPQGQIQSKAENEALVSSVDWKEPDHLAAAAQASSHLQACNPQSSLTTLYIGKDKVPFHIPSSVLRQKSPYFTKLLAEDTGHDGKVHSAEHMAFGDIDDFTMALFMHWLTTDGKLAGPHDFHSFGHYLGLYMLAQKFEIESLQNQVMDLVRDYYREQNMTAAPYRLEYIYTITHGPNHMRAFLVSTAAFRLLEEHSKSPAVTEPTPASSGNAFISESMREVLSKNAELSVDFANELVNLHRNGEHDARRGSDCHWHVHTHTQACPAEKTEPWQFDGPGDDKVGGSLCRNS